MIREVTKHRDVSHDLKLNDHWEVAVLLSYNYDLCIGHDTSTTGMAYFYFPDAPEVLDILSKMKNQELSVDPFRLEKFYQEVKDIYYSYKREL